MMNIDGREYVTGLDRLDGVEGLRYRTHLYEGTFDKIGKPMCARGWNREDGHGFSILRNNVGDLGVCKVCLRRARAGLPGVAARDRKTRWL